MNGEQKNSIRLTVTTDGDIETILDFDSLDVLNIITKGGKEVSVDSKLVYQFLQFIYAE